MFTVEEQRKRMEAFFHEEVGKGLIKFVSDTKEVDGHRVGDVVRLHNTYMEEVGPFKILAFDEFGDMFLDWGCYWFRVPVDRIIETVEKGGAE